MGIWLWGLCGLYRKWRREESDEAHVGCVHSQHRHSVASISSGLNWGDELETIALHSAAIEQVEEIHQVFFIFN